jgi:GNAT superfamily N-acetyltransferase
VLFHELSAAHSDLALLAQFYSGLYSHEFPDPDERESYTNMVAYLRGAAADQCQYRIMLLLEGDQPVGGSISDYFAPSNTGVIEFLVIAPEYRRLGVGTDLLAVVERRLISDALVRGRTLRFIAAEINDPFRHTSKPENMDPFRRAAWWGDRGYAKLDFPYVLPALSLEQEAVHNLALCAKLTAAEGASSIPSESVDGFLRDYLVYAMRISEPLTSAEYAYMVDWLAQRANIDVVSLRAYVGDDLPPALLIPRVTERRGQDWYHHWTVDLGASDADRPCISFFTLSRAGFCKQLDAESLGPDRLRAIVARIERQMMADNDSVRGWYIEARNGSSAAALGVCGFYEVAAGIETPEVRLLYKEFGAQYASPVVEASEFVAFISEVVKCAFDAGEPEQRAALMKAASVGRTWRTVPFR